MCLCSEHKAQSRDLGALCPIKLFISQTFSEHPSCHALLQTMDGEIIKISKHMTKWGIMSGHVLEKGLISSNIEQLSIK